MLPYAAQLYSAVASTNLTARTLFTSRFRLGNVPPASMTHPFLALSYTGGSTDTKVIYKLEHAIDVAGPWMPLATVTLTNSAKSFDNSTDSNNVCVLTYIRLRLEVQGTAATDTTAAIAIGSTVEFAVEAVS